MSKIVNKYLDYIKSINKKHNWDAIPKKFKVKEPIHEPNLELKEIGIGEAEPVLKFKEWNTTFFKKTS